MDNRRLIAEILKKVAIWSPKVALHYFCILCIIFIYSLLFKYSFLTLSILLSLNLTSYLPAFAMSRNFESPANNVIALFSFGCPERSLRVNSNSCIVAFKVFELRGSNCGKNDTISDADDGKRSFWMNLNMSTTTKRVTIFFHFKIIHKIPSAYKY